MRFCGATLEPTKIFRNFVKVWWLLSFDNQTIHNMKINDQQAIYVSPKVKTVEIKAQAIICQSGFYNENESYKEGDTSSWFNS